MIVQPYGALAWKTVTPATVHFSSATTPSPYVHDEPDPDFAMPATPVTFALHEAHTVMPTMLAQICAYAAPEAVAPQHVIR